ncbi:MAG: polysaccharide pyruvyl transferase family protein [Cetobacterium sp.]
MLNLIKNKLKYELENLNFFLMKSCYRKKTKIIFLSTPEHGNLGDHAITIAINKILKDKYPKNKILEFSFNKYNERKNDIKSIVNSNDMIYLVGGGNFGNLYPWEENQRRDIIKRFPNNKIVIMPQSLSFSDDEDGRKELSISKKIASEHKNLTIIARDEKSYSFAKKEFNKNNILLAPDSVLYLEDYYLNKMTQERKDVIFTIRKDKEKILSDEKIKEIQNILDKNKINYEVTDTTVNYGVNKKTRDYEVEKILKKISGSKLNITDRFHGVIFSVITNTPVIVFKSLDHKIEEGIKWFKHLDYVHYVSEKDNIEDIINKYIGNQTEVSKSDYRLKNKLIEVLKKI